MHDEDANPQCERIIELTVRNHPGVMVHVANLFARRGFNLDGILCGSLAGGGQSRMLLLVGADARMGQVMRQLEKLHDVLEVRLRGDLASDVFDVGRIVAREDRSLTAVVSGQPSRPSA